MKKQDYLKWDEYFMGIAMLSAQRSKDPNTSVGSCIVSFTLTSMFFLKEKVKAVQISALILCISGLVFLAIG